MKDAKIETIGDLIEAVNQSADPEKDPKLPRERLLYDWNRPKGEEFLSLQTWGRISDILEKDVPLFVDYFSPMFAEVKRQDLNSIIGILETRSKSSIEHYEKYRWVAKYLLATVYRRVGEEDDLASSESATRLNKI